MGDACRLVKWAVLLDVLVFAPIFVLMLFCLSVIVAGVNDTYTTAIDSQHGDAIKGDPHSILASSASPRTRVSSLAK